MKYDELINAGINMKSLKERLMGNVSLLERFLGKFINNTNYDSLLNAIDDENWEKACDSAHALKGMCGNLSLDELYELFSSQVTFFRAGEIESACALMKDISEKYENAITLISDWLGEE